MRRSIALAFSISVVGTACARRGVTSEQVLEHAIREGVHFLKAQQHDGSWTEAEAQVKTGTTSLVTLALLTAGEPVPNRRRSRIP